MNELQGQQLSLDGGSDSDSGARLLRMLWRGKWLILILPLIAAGGAYYKLRKSTPIYRATAKLGVSVKEAQVLSKSDSGTGKQRNFLKQQEQLFKSPPILLPLSQIEGVDELKHFRRIGGKPIISEISDRLSARADMNTDIIAISFESAFKRDAVWMVDKAVEVYREHNKEMRKKANQEIRGLVEDERDELIERLEDITQEVLDHKAQYPELLNNQTASLVSERKNQIYKALTGVKMELAPLRGTYAKILADSEDEERFKEIGKDRRSQAANSVLEGQISQFTTDLQAKQSELAENLIGGMTEEANPIKKLRAEIQSLEERIASIHIEYARAYLSETRSSLEEFQRQEEALQEEVDGLEADVQRINRAEEELALIEGRRSQVREELSVLNSRILELEVGEEGGGLNIQQYSEARAGSDPVSPDVEKTYMYFIGPALGLALAITLLRGFRDKRIWTVEEVPDLIGASVVAVVPELTGSKDRSRVGRIVVEEPESLAAEAIRSVRTATSFGLPNDGCGVVLVTSSVSGEGKSVSASNLALALGQAGRRTLLVDADLRKPGQHEIHDCYSDPGLGDALRQHCMVNDAIQHGIAPGLDLLSAGDCGGSAAELIESQDFRNLMEGLRADYDVVVLDSSPALETSETRMLASLSDVIVFVMRLNVSSGPDAVRARDILLGVGGDILGVMLNGAKSKKGAKSYAGGIAYGYGHGARRDPEQAAGTGASGGGAPGEPEKPPFPDRAASERRDKGLEAWS